MRVAIEAIKKQIQALVATVDPVSTQQLHNRDFVTQLADCIAKTYVLLNEGMCEELTVCRSCAQQRDFLRDTLTVFEEVARSGSVSYADEQHYYNFVGRLKEMQVNIDDAQQRLEETSTPGANAT